MQYVVPPYYTVTITDTIKVTSSSSLKKGGEITQMVDTNGYLKVMLLPFKGSRTKKTVRVHILVAELVYGPRPDGLVINHKDGNKLNNHPSNLEYVTQQRNMQHAHEIGLAAPQNGSNNGNWKGGVCQDMKAYNRERMRKKRAINPQYGR